jgi:hypothetical protein
MSDNEREEEKHLIVDVYHHFDAETREFIRTFTETLRRPIIVKITSGKPAGIKLTLGIPRHN